MKTTAYWCFICATALAIAALWFYNGGQAQAADFTTTTYVSTAPTDTVVKSTILDSSRYPEVTAKLECAGTDVSDMVRSCATALNELCPDGGTVNSMGETPPGVLPARIEVTIVCLRETPGS